jgi:hypothetical protein
MPFSVIDDGDADADINSRSPSWYIFLFAGAVGRCNGLYQTREKYGSISKTSQFPCVIIINNKP